MNPQVLCVSKETGNRLDVEMNGNNQRIHAYCRKNDTLDPLVIGKKHLAEIQNGEQVEIVIAVVRTDNKHETMKSLLLDYAQPMHPMADAPYHYDYQKDLNVYNDRIRGEIPFVDCPDEILCISTKTETIRETDDSASWCLVLGTKTFSEKESDD